MCDVPALEKECDYCKGEDMVDGEVCTVCNGDRLVLTAFGERLVDLIDRRVSVAIGRVNRVVG